jgi:hypothetical protein
MCTYLFNQVIGKQKQDTELFYTVWLKNRGESREKKKEARGEIQGNGDTEPEGGGEECGEGRE